MKQRQLLALLKQMFVQERMCNQNILCGSAQNTFCLSIIILLYRNSEFFLCWFAFRNFAECVY